MDSSLWIVAAAAGVTAIMTGVGALPILFARTPGPRTVGWANTVAGGLMLAFAAMMAFQILVLAP